ncbi:unnamed protein product, partial [Brenthis ino]
MLPWLQHRWTALWLLISALGAFCLFLYGFFPLKYHTGKFGRIEDLPNFINSVSIDGGVVYKSAGENSVILMVIDGLRYDFVSEENMPFTGQLLKDKLACIYVCVAEPPTVTMPKIKSPERKKEKAQWRRTINFWRDIFAMMTGTVSTFADVALNFGAPAVTGDSVLRVAKSIGKKSILYGDDTWLRLFPGLWAEADGTTSFFVTDYTEVDTNVTRHLNKTLTPDENRKPIFDFLVLHYLGLDHIGHLEGAKSPKIKPKLLEMDEVIKNIYTAMQTWDRDGVLIICGDHGMRDAGGHGGATPAEVLVPLVLVKSNNFKCPYPAGPGPSVAQTDVAPTLAWLLGAPPPGDSAGRVLPALLPQDPTQHLYLLHVLAERNKRYLPEHAELYKQIERARIQFAHYLATGQESAAKISKEFYEEALAEMAKYLTETTTDFDLYAIVLATVLLYLLVGALACTTLFSLQPEPLRKISVTKLHKPKAGTLLAFAIMYSIISSIVATSCFLSETKSEFCSFKPEWCIIFLTVSFIMTLAYFTIKTGIERIKDLSTLRDLNAIDYLLICGTLFHSWSFFGTSFIEEEHMTWYYFWNTLMFFVLIRTIVVVVMYFTKRLSGATEFQEKPELENKMSLVGVSVVPQWVLLIALHRYLRTMNQTGDRWMFLPDTADWLNAPENSIYLEAHIVIGTVLTLAICLWNVRYMNNYMQMHSAITTIAAACILFYRITTNSLQTPFETIKSWDPVIIIDVFWGLLIAQVCLELLTYIGVFKICGFKITGNKFVYNKPKAKEEDYFYDENSQPWNLEDVKLKLVRSITHIMYNDLMLIVILLMRPHNVIMVPSIYFTCHLTSKCLDHKLLDARTARRTEVADILSKSLVHLWIGVLFFFYQGNSNSLASVDLGAGYVGLREYGAARVALRMGLHAYAAPALAGAALFAGLARAATDWRQYVQSVWRVTNIYALQRVYQVVIYCVIATVFRYHLFVWSVFSPKLLYDFVATVFSIQALSTIGVIILLTHATSWVAKIFTFKSTL